MAKISFVDEDRIFMGNVNGVETPCFCVFESQTALAGVALESEDPFDLSLFVVQKKAFHDPILVYASADKGRMLIEQILKEIHKDDKGHLEALDKARHIMDQRYRDQGLPGLRILQPKKKEEKVEIDHSKQQEENAAFMAEHKDMFDF